ncbi:membrane metallo-endopeptidase-like 1 [Haemaphysalis longicornis]
MELTSHAPLLCPPQTQDKAAPVLWRAVCVFSLVLALATVLVALLLLLRTHASRQKLCTSADCVEHARRLGVGRPDAKRTPPCEDFGRFVCSAAANRHPWTAKVLSTHMLLDYLAAVGSTLPREPVLARPTLAMRACLDSSSRDDGDAQSLVDLVRNTSFDWPASDDELPDEGDYSKPTKALVELSTKWALPLWFRVSVAPSLDGRRTVVLTPSHMVLVWIDYQRALVKLVDRYPLYVDQYNSVFISKRRAAPAFVAFLRNQSLDVQGVIFDKLEGAVTKENWRPRYHLLRDLPTRMPKHKPADWVSVLQWAFAVRPPITQDDGFLSTNSHLVEAMASLMERLTARQLLFHTTWWFLQSVGPLASCAILSIADIDERGAVFQKLFCGMHVDYVYNVALAAAHKLRFSEPQRLAAYGILEAVRSSSVENVHALRNVSHQTKSFLESMLNGAKIVLWPDDERVSIRNLGRYYGQLESNESFTSTFSEWRSTRFQVQRFLGDGELDLSSMVFQMYSAQLAAHDFVRNILFVSVAAMASPLYYTRGTSAMLYGGLGSVFGRQLVSVIGAADQLLNGEPSVVPSLEEPRKYFWDDSHCQDADFQALAALSFAHTAYLRSGNKLEDLPLPGLEDFTPEQVFFITFCHILCWFRESGGVPVTKCNGAVKNFPPFASAFSCPPGSPMNPETHCTPF